MPACYSLDLIVEIPWPDASVPEDALVPYLPQGSAALSGTIFPNRAGSGPSTLLDLAMQLFGAPATRARTIDWTGSRREAEARAIEQQRWPSVTGIILAARYLAFRRHAKQMAQGHALDALALACPASFAIELQAHSDAAALAFERRRQRAMQRADAVEREYVLLLATFGPSILPSSLSTLIPQLIRLFDPNILHQTTMFTDAHAMTRHLLRRTLPGSRAEAVLRNPERFVAATDAVMGMDIVHARTFVWRVFRTIIREADMVDVYVEQVLSGAGIEAPPVDYFLEDDGRPRALPHTAPTARLSARAARATTALTRLLPQQPHVVRVLAGKAALLGTDVRPSPLLLSGGTRAERECVLRAVAEATDTAFVAVDASQLLHLATPTALFDRPQVTVLPTNRPHIIGTIVLLDGCDDLFGQGEIDYDGHRRQRTAAQRALAELLAGRVPVTLLLQEWPSAPILFICGADEEGPVHAWDARGDVVPVLRDQLSERVQLPSAPSLALMVELLRTLLRREARGPSSAAEDMISRLEVPDETLVAAARLAQRKHAGVTGARHIVEAAARRAVLRQPTDDDPMSRVIAPDDLSGADLSD